MKNDEDEIEDSTKYGEFVSTYFAWLTLEGQKERANNLDKMTKRKKEKWKPWKLKLFCVIIYITKKERRYKYAI